MALKVCILALICISSVSAEFDCKRLKADLCNGGDCNDDGTCSNCPSGTQGGDCGLDTANIDQPPCNSECVNGGTCQSADSTATCYCPDRFTGLTCEMPMYDVDCTTADEMTMTIRPYIPTFPGEIYVNGQSTGCKFALATGNAYELTLAFTDCGGATQTQVDGKIRNSFVVIARYANTFISKQDEIVTFTCGAGSVVEKRYEGVTVTSVNENLKPENTGNVPVDNDVSFDLTDAAGEVITGPIALGGRITVTVDLTDLGKTQFTAIRVKSCSAQSGTDPTAEGFVEKQFVIDSCIAADLVTMMIGQIVRTGTAAAFKFHAFKFLPTDIIIITCIVDVCSVADDCDAIQCDGENPFAGNGRKKREANEEKVVQRAIAIIDPLVSAAETLKEFQETKDCYQSWEMTATVVALAVALLLVILLCIILIIKAVVARKSSSNYREDISETTSTTNFPHLPTIVSNKA